MDSSKIILKNAFIDAECEFLLPSTHNFSPQFERKMQYILKYQKGFRRLINTTGKRVACLVLTLVICLTTVACSVKEIREPIIEEVEKFFVNAKELFMGTSAEEISDVFPSDITKIVGISYISKTQNQYVIDEEEKVIDFVELLSTTYWGEPGQFEDFDETNTYWSFDFYNVQDQCDFSIKMCNDSFYNKSKVAIIKDGQELHYYISNQTYSEILAFTNRKYYIHDSKLERPSKEFCNKQKQDAIIGMNEDEAKKIKKEIRNAHYSIEIFLMENVSLLKEKNSVYWEYVLSGEKFVDPISHWESQYTVYSDVITSLDCVIDTSKNEHNIEFFKQLKKNIIKSFKNHDLEGLFKNHEIIHDFDYYCFNYPTRFVYNSRADYQGLDDYFGYLEQ